MVSAVDEVGDEVEAVGLLEEEVSVVVVEEVAEAETGDGSVLAFRILIHVSDFS